MFHPIFVSGDIPWTIYYVGPAHPSIQQLGDVSGSEVDVYQTEFRSKTTYLSGMYCSSSLSGYVTVLEVIVVVIGEYTRGYSST